VFFLFFSSSIDSIIVGHQQFIRIGISIIMIIIRNVIFLKRKWARVCVSAQRQVCSADKRETPKKTRQNRQIKRKRGGACVCVCANGEGQRKRYEICP